MLAILASIAIGALAIRYLSLGGVAATAVAVALVDFVAAGVASGNWLAAMLPCVLVVAGFNAGLMSGLVAAFMPASGH
jgi:hypothetical protein